MSSHGHRRRYYTPDEVAQHNSGKDCWVSIFGRVFDLTDLIAKNRGPLTQPIIDVRETLVWGSEFVYYLRAVYISLFEKKTFILCRLAKEFTGPKLHIADKLTLLSCPVSLLECGERPVPLVR